MKKIRVYAHASPETMIEAGEKAGLTEPAVNFLRYFGEVELELTVLEDGTVTAAKVVGHYEKKEP